MSLLCHFSETEVKRLRQRTGSKQTVYKNPSFKGLELVVGKKVKPGISERQLSEKSLVIGRI